MQQFKIGEIITFTKDIPITTFIGGKKVEIKAGNKGVVTRKLGETSGEVEVLDGPGRGKIFVVEAEVAGYDVEDISSTISKSIINNLRDGVIDDDIGPEITDIIAETLEKFM